MKHSESSEIRSIYVSMKERRINFYKKIIKEFSEDEDG